MLTREFNQLHTDIINHRSVLRGKLGVDDSPSGRVYAVKHRHNQGRIVYLKPAVETDDLKDSGNREEYEG
jgi:hypothetical protein